MVDNNLGVCLKGKTEGIKTKQLLHILIIKMTRESRLMTIYYVRSAISADSYVLVIGGSCSGLQKLDYGINYFLRLLQLVQKAEARLITEPLRADYSAQ